MSASTGGGGGINTACVTTGFHRKHLRTRVAGRVLRRVRTEVSTERHAGRLSRRNGNKQGIWKEAGEAGTGKAGREGSWRKRFGKKVWKESRGLERGGSERGGTGLDSSAFPQRV